MGQNSELQMTSKWAETEKSELCIGFTWLQSNNKNNLQSTTSKTSKRRKITTLAIAIWSK
ncbi:MAG: hypothetical protein ACD_80C00057G0006 [uncultured bacterium (gcode 4)]|uniref:Uncharacterized protein n=1 Tax=uncultured bacterium (gcode 4) TaxID=1234023 RepID=K1XYJ8_9BACT|nr:MAG: hypothetical protein ACD_80C00057G0006 [uncultured bacterium (gcode 4)]